MCLGLATGFCKPNQPAKRYLVTLYNEYAHITQQKTFEGKDLWDALKGRKCYIQRHNIACLLLFKR